MFFRNICFLALMFMSVGSFAASIRIEVPARYFQIEDSVVYATAKLIHNQSETNKILFRDGDYYRNEFYVSVPGLYKVEVTIELSSGETFSDWANGYILSIEDVKKVRPTLNPNCFNSTFSVFWVSDAVIRPSDLFGLSIDTSLLKRVDIPDIDSIAEAFQGEGMNWCLELLVHYELLDENHIPLIKYPSGYFRNAITTCQMMFAFHSQYKKTHDSADMQGFLNNANWLANNNHSGYYLYDFNFTHDGGTQMKKYWVSAMAQGYAAGALSYAFNVTRDSLYLKEADSVFVTLHQNSSDFWCFMIDNKGYYWLEEYPNEDLCHVLNGKMAALWGIFQYYTVSRNKVALRVLEAGIKSVIDNYRIWSVPRNNNSYYCLHKNTKAHYHAVHQIQFLAFAARFDMDEFYDAYYCFLNAPILVEPHDIRFSYLPDMVKVYVESPVSWYVEEQIEWLHTSIQDNKIIITADSNLTDKIRSATIDVILENGDSEKICITQEMEYYFTASYNTFTMDSYLDTLFISYNTNAPDFELKPEPGWLHADKINNSLRFISEENHSFEPRSVEQLVFYENILLSNFVIKQKALVPYIDLESDTVWLNSSEDIIEIKVNTNIPGIELLCYNNWLSFGWSNDSTIWLSSATGNRTGEIILDTPYLTEDVIIVCNDFTTQIKVKDDSDFTVFPNPAHDILQLISHNTAVAYTYQFKNLFGITLKSGISSESTTIDVSDFKPGIYFLVITSWSSDSSMYKIIVY